MSRHAAPARPGPRHAVLVPLVGALLAAAIVIAAVVFVSTGVRSVAGGGVTSPAPTTTQTPSGESRKDESRTWAFDSITVPSLP